MTGTVSIMEAGFMRAVRIDLLSKGPAVILSSHPEALASWSGPHLPGVTTETVLFTMLA